jgi:hypothetical protein
LLERLDTVPQILDGILAEGKKFLKLTGGENINGGDYGDRRLGFGTLVVSHWTVI